MPNSRDTQPPVLGGLSGRTSGTMRQIPAAPPYSGVSHRAGVARGAPEEPAEPEGCRAAMRAPLLQSAARLMTTLLTGMSALPRGTWQRFSSPSRYAIVALPPAQAARQVILATATAVTLPLPACFMHRHAGCQRCADLLAGRRRSVSTQPASTGCLAGVANRRPRPHRCTHRRPVYTSVRIHARMRPVPCPALHASACQRRTGLHDHKDLLGLQRGAASRGLRAGRRAATRAPPQQAPATRLPIWTAATDRGGYRRVRLHTREHCRATSCSNAWLLARDGRVAHRLAHPETDKMVHCRAGSKHARRLRACVRRCAQGQGQSRRGRTHLPQ